MLWFWGVAIFAMFQGMNIYSWISLFFLNSEDPRYFWMIYPERETEQTDIFLCVIFCLASQQLMFQPFFGNSSKVVVMCSTCRLRLRGALQPAYPATPSAWKKLRPAMKRFVNLPSRKWTNVTKKRTISKGKDRLPSSNSQVQIVSFRESNHHFPFIREVGAIKPSFFRLGVGTVPCDS